MSRIIYKSLIMSLVVILLIAIPAETTVRGAPPDRPLTLWGTLSLDGDKETAGIVIRVLVNGTEKTTTTVQADAGDDLYLVDVNELTAGDVVSFGVAVRPSCIAGSK